MTAYTNFSVSSIVRITKWAVEFTSELVRGGRHWLVFYRNGYGLSAVKYYGTYGAEMDLWEVAVIRRDGTGFEIVYDTPVTPYGDVLGFLSDDEVADVAEKIRSLQ